jgi:hypothetical protein
MDLMEGLAILEYLDGRFLKPLERGAWASRRGKGRFAFSPLMNLPGIQRFETSE